jgi:single-strand DNA-binding protein
VNKVHLAGKISRLGQLKYTPSGLPLLEFTLAVTQEAYSKTNIGYFQVVVSGRQAEDLKGKLKIGTNVTLQGQLYQRAYTSRAGDKVDEVKIILETFGG